MRRAGAPAVTLVLAAVLATSTARAQTRAAPRVPFENGSGHVSREPPPPERRTDTDDPLPLIAPGDPGAPVDEAQARFRHGVQLYANGDAAGALVELKRAYAVVPNFRILFNLGRVAYQCGDYAAAFGYLTRYLTEAGGRVPEPRRREVAHDLAELRARVGYLSIETREAALHVLVDDADVGTTPLAAPIPANVGQRRIEVVAPSGERQARVVQLTAGEILSVAFVAPVPRPSAAPADQPRAAPRGRQRPVAPPSRNVVSVEPEAPDAVPLPEIGPPSAPPPLAPATLQPATPPGLTLAPGSPARDRPGRTVPWLTWTLAAAAAGGAAATGALAWSASRDLHDKEAMFPVKRMICRRCTRGSAGLRWPVTACSPEPSSCRPSRCSSRSARRPATAIDPAR